MLRYVSAGERRYDLNPIPVTRRLNWEFEAVVAGRMAPVFNSGQYQARERTLWVFPPNTAHGWINPPRERCEVAVVQVASAPEPLRSLATTRGFLAAELRDDEIARIRESTAGLMRENARPTALGGLLVQRALADLCLIALRAEPVRLLPTIARRARDVADSAIAWYAENLARDPTLADVARAVGTSTSHLRRIFHTAYGKSPHEALQRVRFERAHELMRDRRLNLEAVASACGFSDASAFSRAYRAHHGHAPGQWRRDLMP
ncbi:MAG: helix-turn-helix transcriptional regulator [Planctomycetes bacterium]|nr:helix-turn-helix transcriptional regulator [Planctomycetota bacterium]